MTERITVVKIGGNVIDDAAALKRFLGEFAALPGAKILVHGGGKLATRLAERLELEVRMVEGRRITDKGMLDVVTMVYAGLVNKQIVAGLQAAGCNAIGLSGADGNIVTARRRAPEPVDFGFVGDIERVDHKLLGRLLDAGCKFQLNLLSLTGWHGEHAKKLAEELIRRDLYTFVGTDLHSFPHLNAIETLSVESRQAEAVEKLKENNLLLWQ